MGLIVSGGVLWGKKGWALGQVGSEWGMWGSLGQVGLGGVEGMRGALGQLRSEGGYVGGFGAGRVELWGD